MNQVFHPLPFLYRILIALIVLVVCDSVIIAQDYSDDRGSIDDVAENLANGLWDAYCLNGHDGSNAHIDGELLDFATYFRKEALTKSNLAHALVLLADIRKNKTTDRQLVDVCEQAAVTGTRNSRLLLGYLKLFVDKSDEQSVAKAKKIFEEYATEDWNCPRKVDSGAAHVRLL